MHNSSRGRRWEFSSNGIALLFAKDVAVGWGDSNLIQLGSSQFPIYYTGSSDLSSDQSKL